MTTTPQEPAPEADDPTIVDPLDPDPDSDVPGAPGEPGIGEGVPH